jgi:hypothetical protein
MLGDVAIGTDQFGPDSHGDGVADGVDLDATDIED